MSLEDKRKHGAEAQARWRRRHPEKNRLQQIERQHLPKEKERQRKLKARQRKLPGHYDRIKKYLSRPEVRARVLARNRSEKCRKRIAAWQLKNKDRLDAKRLLHYRANKHLFLAKCRAYQIRKKNAVPKWADMEKIKEIYRQAVLLGMEVDHIIPIKHDLVCGLHVENNLQLLTQRENAQKHNIWPWPRK